MRLFYSGTKSSELKEMFARDIRNAERAVKAGVTYRTTKLKETLRSQVTSAGLGTKLANGIRGDVYPSGASAGAAGHVYARPSRSATGGAAGILSSYEKGAILRASNGRKYLAIPTDAVPAGTTQSYRQIMEKYKGSIKFVPRNAGGFYVIVSASVGKKTGKLRRARSGARNAKQILLFVLVPMVMVKKRLDWKSEATKAIDALAGDILKEWRDD